MSDHGGSHDPADIDPHRFAVHTASPRGLRQAYVREGMGGVPLLLVHGWPETKRIYWKVIAPLADAGFDVIVPDLRGFGDSDVATGFHDVPAHSRDLYALVHDHLGLDGVVLCGGDLGGPVIQDMSLRFPQWVDRMVLFNSPLPFDKEEMAGMATRPAIEASDYFVRQGTDPDGLAAELDTPEKRRRYIATFYTSRFWAHPGAFTVRGSSGRFGASEAVDFHTEPFADGKKLRASFGGYESTFSGAARSEPTTMATPNFTQLPHLVRHLRSRDLPRVRPHGCGRVPEARGAVLAPRLRPLRALGSTARPGQRPGRVLRRQAEACPADVPPLMSRVDSPPSRVQSRKYSLCGGGPIPSSTREVEMPSSTPEAEEAPPD